MIDSFSQAPKLVIFDLIGTLINPGVMHHPFRQLMKWARENGRPPRSDDARSLMTINRDVSGIASALGISTPIWLVKQIHAEIEAELESLSLYGDVLPTLNALCERNISIAICSNLASPYGKIVNLLLREFQFIRCMSYETGFIKPEQEIYQAVVGMAQLRPEHCLFVGDTLLADYEGPRQFGMNARHLVRGKPAVGDTINSLADLVR